MLSWSQFKVDRRVGQPPANQQYPGLVGSWKYSNSISTVPLSSWRTHSNAK